MSLKVLVVDDDEEMLSLMKTMLKVSGFVPLTISDPRDALKFAEQEQPDMILLDIMMPHIDGFQLCKMIRNSVSLANVPVVFVSAYGNPDLQERSDESGANFFINKPVTPQIIKTAVAQATQV